MTEQDVINDKRTILRLKLEKFLFLDMWMDELPQIEEDVYIYGAGEVGKLLLRCFKKKPKGFIDIKKDMKDINQIPVYCIDELPMNLLDDECIVIVTPVWAMSTIKSKIEQNNPNTRIINLEELVKDL